MSYGKYLLVFLVILTSIPSAFSQDAVIDLNHEELNPHQRPIVSFDHQNHSEKIVDCQRCHHDYDQYLNNKGGEGQPCSACHTRSAKGAIPLLEATHTLCRGCHEDLLLLRRPSGPITCGECHVRK